MAKQTRKVNTIKNGTIELVLLLLLQTNKKYGYQLAQEMSELSNGKYELKEATMYPTCLLYTSLRQIIIHIIIYLHQLFRIRPPDSRQHKNYHNRNSKSNYTIKKFLFHLLIPHLQ